MNNFPKNSNLIVLLKCQQSLVLLRVSEPQDRDAEIVRDALFGGRLDLNSVIIVACTRSSLELHAIKQAYRIRYNSDVEQDITLKTQGGFKEVYIFS